MKFLNDSLSAFSCERVLNKYLLFSEAFFEEHLNMFSINTVSFVNVLTDEYVQLLKKKCFLFA